MAHTPQGEKALTLQPVEILGRGNLASQELELVALAAMVFKLIGQAFRDLGYTSKAASVSKCLRTSALR